MLIEFLSSSIFFVVIALAVIVIMVVLMFSRSKRIFFSPRSLKDEMLRSSLEAQRIIKEAEGEALRLNQEAVRQSSLLLGHTQSLNEKIERELEIMLQERVNEESIRIADFANKILKEYQDIFSRTEQSYKDAFDKISTNTTHEAKEGVAKFLVELRDEVKGQESVWGKKFEELHEEAKKEIQAYQDAAFKKIDNSIFNLLMLMSREVLGRALNLEDHQELIVRALEDAKREGLFVK